jgi:hypothetical protein
MTILYANPMQNMSTDGGQSEYLVIQRKLSEMKQSVLDEPHQSKDSSQSGKNDLQKSISILEKA